MKEAIKILSEKQSISEPTFRKWCKDGIIEFHTEDHGTLKYRVFDMPELERIKALLPGERVIGLSLLPRASKENVKVLS